MSPRSPDPRRPYLLLPGPTEVAPEVAAAATEPMIGHREPAMTDLLTDTMGRAAAWVGSQAPLLPFPSSSTGLMEAAVRNTPRGRFLHVVAGAFSRRWSQVRASCGREADELEVEEGKALRPERLAEALDRREYVAVTLVHNETSTGVIQPLQELAGVVRSVGGSPPLLLVDAVSSMAASPIEFDRWGLDLCFAGTQKAWALPPGLTLCAVSTCMLEAARRSPQRGWYFDLVRWTEEGGRGRTPVTPPISLLQQLRVQLGRMEREGIEARFRRHRRLRDRVLAWADGSCEVLAEPGAESPTVTCLRPRRRSAEEVVQDMLQRGWRLAPGYGDLRRDWFRIGHLGEMRPERLDQALDDLSAVLGGGGSPSSVS